MGDVTHLSGLVIAVTSYGHGVVSASPSWCLTSVYSFFGLQLGMARYAPTTATLRAGSIILVLSCWHATGRLGSPDPLDTQCQVMAYALAVGRYGILEPHHHLHSASAQFLLCVVLSASHRGSIHPASPCPTAVLFDKF